MSRKPFTIENQRPRHTLSIFGRVLAPKGRGRTCCMDVDQEELLSDLVVQNLRCSRLALVRGTMPVVLASMLGLSDEAAPASPGTEDSEPEGSLEDIFAQSRRADEDAKAAEAEEAAQLEEVRAAAARLAEKAAAAEREEAERAEAAAAAAAARAEEEAAAEAARLEEEAAALAAKEAEEAALAEAGDTADLVEAEVPEGADAGAPAPGAELLAQVRALFVSEGSEAAAALLGEQGYDELRAVCEAQGVAPSRSKADCAESIIKALEAEVPAEEM